MLAEPGNDKKWLNSNVNSEKKDDKTLTVFKLCVVTIFITFLENAKTWVGRTSLNGRKRGIALGDKKITPRP